MMELVAIVVVSVAMLTVAVRNSGREKSCSRGADEAVERAVNVQTALLESLESRGSTIVDPEPHPIAN